MVPNLLPALAVVRLTVSVAEPPTGMLLGIALFKAKPGAR